MNSTRQLIPVILGGGLLWTTILEWVKKDEQMHVVLGLLSLVLESVVLTLSRTRIVNPFISFTEVFVAHWLATRAGIHRSMVLG